MSAQQTYQDKYKKLLKCGFTLPLERYTEEFRILSTERKMDEETTVYNFIDGLRRDTGLLHVVASYRLTRGSKCSHLFGSATREAVSVARLKMRHGPSHSAQTDVNS